MTTQELLVKVVDNVPNGNYRVGIKVAGHGLMENSEYARVTSTIAAVVETFSSILGKVEDVTIVDGCFYLNFPDHWSVSTWIYN